MLRRLFLPTAQKAAGCAAPLLLLPAKSHAAPPLFACKRAHNALACYQLFAEKGKGAAFSQRLAVSIQNPGGRSPEGFSRPAGPPAATFFARVFACGRIAVLQSKMGVFQTPKQFLPGVDRALARTTPALPAKSHAAPPLFACKRAHNALACYQLFAVKGKDAAFSQRLAVSVQNPGGRSPEGFSCPIWPRTKIPGCCRIRAFLYQQSGPGDRSPCFSARTSSRVQGWVL